jgi:outer membrane protein OmpA-like peptidoglycan-associated protein
MARPVAGVLGLAFGFIAWSAAADTIVPGQKPRLTAAPLPAVKPMAPERQPTEAAVAPDLLARIDFAPREMTLTQSGQERLAALARRLKEEPDAPVAILAYAGVPGAAASARRISLGRALAVRSFLMQRGVAGGRMTVRALESPAGTAPSERVDILWPPR